MTDTGFFVPKEKLSRLALIHGEDAAGKLTPPDDSRGDPTVPPAAAFGGHGLFSTAADYARFCEMLLGGGELGGARILAPRTVEMWRTNHLAADPLKTVRAGTGWGLGAAGRHRRGGGRRAVLGRLGQLVGHRRHVVLDRSRARLRLHRHDPALGPDAAQRDADSRLFPQPGLSGHPRLTARRKRCDSGAPGCSCSSRCWRRRAAPRSRARLRRPANGATTAATLAAAAIRRWRRSPPRTSPACRWRGSGPRWTTPWWPPIRHPVRAPTRTRR